MLGGVVPAWVNLGYLRAGLLRPDFGVIQEAFTFNFFTLPLVLMCAGVVYVGAGVLQAGSTGRWGLGIAGGVLLAAGAGILGLRHYITEVEPNRLIVEERTIRSPRVREPLRLLHFSDLQSDRVGAFEQEVFARIVAMDPDLVIYTGDWVQPVAPATYASEMPTMLALIRRLKPRLGFFGTYGDTDAPWYSLDPSELGPLVMLGTRPYLIEWDGGVIALKGLGLFESRYPEVARAGIAEWFAGVPERAFSLLVGHSPDFVLAAEDYAIDLCLAGHTHGGQIQLPWYGPVLLDSAVPREMAAGLHSRGRTRIHVSSGLGTTHYDGLQAMRLFCPPRMTLLNILPAADQEPDQEYNQ